MDSSGIETIHEILKNHKLVFISYKEITPREFCPKLAPHEHVYRWTNSMS